MGTRERLFRQKLANQIEKLLTDSEVVFGSEKLSEEWLITMLEHTHELSSQLAIYRFLHELPENVDLQVEFLEMEEEESESKKEEKEIPSYGDEILKEIDEFESQEAVDVKPIEEEPEVVVEEAPVAEEEVETVESEDVSSIEEEPNEPQEINEAVANKEPSLADHLRKKSIQKLADSIALNERFLYSNELFNGNMEAFNRALNELDHIASKEDADRFINVQLKENNEWDMDSETVLNFISLVERRFV